MRRIFQTSVQISGFLLLSVAGTAQEEAAETSAPHGLFALSSEAHPIPDSVFTEVGIDGISLRAGWDTLEPNEREYHWTFDTEIERAKKAGKKVMLRVSPGHRTPEWVYRTGAEKFEFRDANPHHETQRETLTIPVPWDPVFLRTWTAFVKAMGKKYGSEESVVLVHLVGPAKTGGEMHLPKTEEDKKNWKRLGYSKEKLVGAWKSVIDSYAEAFPKKPLCLNVALPIYDDGVVEEVMAYGVQKIGRAFGIQHNGLSAKTQENGDQHQWVLSMRGKARIGFQLLCSATGEGRFTENGERFGGTLSEGLKIGLEAGAHYIELYPIDLKDDVSRQAIREAAKYLREHP